MLWLEELTAHPVSGYDSRPFSIQVTLLPMRSATSFLGISPSPRSMGMSVPAKVLTRRSASQASMSPPR